VKFLLSVVIVLQLGNPTVPATNPGAVEGRVLRAGNLEPVEDVSVALISTAQNDDDPVRPPLSLSATTDAQGKFSINDVAPGIYRLTFSANGYIRQQYGQRTFPGNGTEIRVTAGQAIKDLVTQLTPTGAVSGTIRDSDKKLLAGVPVQLMRVNYDQVGQRRLRPVGSTVRTDDRGEFRIYFVTPGTYYVNAGTPQGPPGTGDQRPLANEVPDTFAYVYYPGVTELSLATPIDVQPGVTKSGIDLTLNKVQGVRVSGRIIDATTGKPPENPKVKLAYRDPGTPWDYDLEYMGRGKVIYDKEGTFEFRDVLPGLYAVAVTIDIPGQPTPPQGATPLQRIGYLPVEVGNKDVAGIVVTASPGTSIRGRVRVDGQSDLTGVFQNVTARLGVRLMPTSNGSQPSTPGVPAPNYGPLNPDGTFQIDNMIPGEFRIEIGWVRSAFYLKEARFGSSDLLTSPFRFTGNEPGNLEVVLAPNVAAIEGLVTNNRLSGASGAQVVLVPDKARHRAELFRAVTTDQEGRFRIPNVSPGDYKLYAWESIEAYRWFDMDFIKTFDPFATPVHLNESQRQTINARLIPAQQ
jgi:5-hydroxyisourate hydrolase-like protein (transthyretin family)